MANLQNLNVLFVFKIYKDVYKATIGRKCSRKMVEKPDLALYGGGSRKGQ